MIPPIRSLREDYFVPPDASEKTGRTTNDRAQSILAQISERKRKSTPGYIGVESKQYYYEKYKNFDRESEAEKEATPNKVSTSATSAYLSEIKNLKLIPSPSGLISSKGIEGELNAKNLKLGKNYAVAISKSMRLL